MVYSLLIQVNYKVLTQSQEYTKYVKKKYVETIGKEQLISSRRAQKDTRTDPLQLWLEFSKKIKKLLSDTK